MSIYLAGNPAAAERSRQWRKRTGLKRRNIEYCVGDKDRSIWNPGNCTPVLIGVGGHGFDLFNLLNMLPMTRHRLLKELLPGLNALFGMDYEALKK